MPRWMEVAAVALAAVVLAPLLLVAALAVAATSRGPVLYRQTRIGRHGQPFTLLKFRTMRTDADRTSRLTLGDRDPRTTAVGRVLRRSKIDELPQLWHVLRGQMALVGPRPEVPEYVDLERPDQRCVLAHRPGITDPASLVFRHEADLLADTAEPDRFYRERLLPVKLALSAHYLESRSLRSDLVVLWATLVAVVRSRPHDLPPELLASMEGGGSWHAS